MSVTLVSPNSTTTMESSSENNLFIMMAKPSKQYRGSNIYPDTVEFSQRMQFCSNLSIDMIHTNFYQDITTNIPNSFSCEKVEFPQSLYFIRPTVGGKEVLYERFSPSHDRDICQVVHKWEQLLNLNCSSLLCHSREKYLESYIHGNTNGETSIYDWINYCRYCNIATKINYVQDGCQIADATVSNILTEFPSSIKYCGYLQFGIPIVFGVSLFDRSYTIMCYCVKDNYFSLYCSYTNQEEILSDAMVYIGLLAHFLSFLVSYFVGMFVIMQHVSLICAYTSLLTWILYWFYLVRYLKTKQTTSAYCSYLLLFVGFVFVLTAMVGASLGLLADSWSLNAYNINVLNYVQSGVGILAVLSFIGVAIWMNVVISRMSDIKLIHTSFLRFVIFASLILTFMSVSFSVTAFMNAPLNDTTNGVFIFLTNALLVSLMIGLSVIEFDKSELLEFYGCCCRCSYSRNKQIKILQIC
ncbi:hypothetical protein C9374_001943 [Naegleria lovaniensis]|uniref:Uncharacterized protein n=1 Tax=Naegleria lovaniensis TaxID=51637 RepID=A0AA88GW16_NAELO|nr:uncharacterized protein C9374_001943 [Naegleria lovaniensis]KAG2386908.1 hypothetical protein C9374_001943 [Naegleria lovaniensis]